MSLTSYLSDETSEISVWFQDNWDFKAFDKILEQVNYRLAKQPMIVDYNVDPLWAGTAFDYAFRWHIEPLKLQSLVAWHGIKYHNIESEIKALTTLVDAANNDASLRSQVSLVLAWFEGIYRSRRIHTKLAEARQMYSVMAEPNVVVDIWLDATKGLPAFDIDDLVESIPDVWGKRLNRAWKPNPTFAGSADVGGADADWMLGDILYECKSSWKRRPFVHGMLHQVVAYAMLDYEDWMGIRSVGVYFPRHRYIYEVSLDEVWGSRDRYEEMRDSFTTLCAGLVMDSSIADWREFDIGGR